MAYIVYNDIKDATEAVDKLNNSTLNEKIIKVKLTRQRDNGENNCQRAGKDGANHDGSLDQEKGSRKRKRPEKKQKNRNGRIIIRNLSFKVRNNLNSLTQNPFVCNIKYMYFLDIVLISFFQYKEK